VDGRSVLVFTSYADTMEYLRDAVLSAGVPVASYSGEGGSIRADGKWVPVAKEEVTAALAAGKIRALVCTDAASEGLNLQAAGALINFDLPWNPSKGRATHRSHRPYRAGSWCPSNREPLPERQRGSARLPGTRPAVRAF